MISTRHGIEAIDRATDRAFDGKVTALVFYRSADGVVHMLEAPDLKVTVCRKSKRRRLAFMQVIFDVPADMAPPGVPFG